MIKHISAVVNPLSSYITKNSKPQPVVPEQNIALPKTLLFALALKITLKKSLYGVFSVIAYLNKNGFAGGCFVKQRNFGNLLKKFGYKDLKERQVRTLCNKLIELGLVTRMQRHRRAPYEYSLTPLGEAFYELKNPTFKPAEKPRADWPDEKKLPVENEKNCRSQLRSSFNKSSYSNSWRDKMSSVQDKPTISLERRQQIESEATKRALEALEKEGLQDPYKNLPEGSKVDYEASRNYDSKLSSYTCFFKNQLSAN